MAEKQVIRKGSRWASKRNPKRPPVIVEWCAFGRVRLRCTLTNAYWTDERRDFLRDFEPAEEAPDAT